MLVGVSRPSEVNTDILRCGISQNVGVKVEKNSKEIETEIAENCLFIISLVAHPVRDPKMAIAYKGCELITEARANTEARAAYLTVNLAG